MKPSTQVVICCGSGGVGKTTVSAALALKWALDGARVAVLTIDPARRLADSLGVGTLDNEPRRVPLERLDQFVPGASGSLDAMMLDVKSTFDQMVARLARTPENAERILAHRYYRFASTRLGGSHEYMAMERLYTLCDQGEYDVVVLDTPPTRHALDFLRAPERMAGLMDQGVLRWLVMPATKGGWRAIELGSEMVSKALKRLLGRGTVGEIADFFDVFRDLWEGFRERSERVDALLSSEQTRFYLVTTTALGVRSDVQYFLEVFSERNLPLAGLVLNRVIQPPVATSIAAIPGHPEETQALRQALDWRHSMAGGLSEAITQLCGSGPNRLELWKIPEQTGEVHTMTCLEALGAYVPPSPCVAPEPAATS